MNPPKVLATLIVLSIAVSNTAQAQERGRDRRAAIDAAGIQRLSTDSVGATEVSVNEATGAARFVRKSPGGRLGRQGARAATDREKANRSTEFLQTYGSIFGIASVSSELREARVLKDAQGGTHVKHHQFYFGVPVFAGEVNSHFDASNDLVAVNGTFVPNIALSPNPTRSAESAVATAIAKIESDLSQSTTLAAAGTTLMVFREGLLQGVDGPNHLAWQVEVSNGTDVREFVYVDAHSGKIIDQITGIRDGLNRRAYNGGNLPTIPPAYPGSPFWVEGQSFPTGTAEADNMILASKETYDFYSKAFGRDSFDGAGATMDSIFNRGYSCPNASWNGTFISFCPGLTTDDVTGHEWTHAYTEYTHNLIYAWQPGALNESYSDIFGETIDRINGRGGDTPNSPRNADSCSIFTGGTPPPTLVITGGSAAGSYPVLASAAEPARPFSVGPTAMAVVSTAAPFQATGACGAVTGVSGKIAIVDWTLTGVANECGSGVRAQNVFNAGATGIIFVAPAAGLLNLGSVATIASVQVTNADGLKIKAGLPASATIAMAANTDNSKRWLLGEDDTATGLTGALRDMWNPRCFGDPGKVSDTLEYACSTADGGGVHTNSGVPNHAYALLVDGGTYNGQTITGIGLTKAAHIYFRAMTIYQGPASDFADHADAIEQSCSDLIGKDLRDLSTGAPSGEIVKAADCAQVTKAALAVELRKPPVQCSFKPLLGQNPPDLCDAGDRVTPLFTENFDHLSRGKSDHDKYDDDRFDDDKSGHDKSDDDDHRKNRGWSVSHTAVVPADFTPRDWTVVSNLPDDRRGRAFFATDPGIGTCAVGGDESGVQQLVSPSITIPASASGPRLTFNHWVATEAGWDGGNVKISVNGGPWVLIQAADFIYNPYNATLVSAPDNTNPLAGQQAFTGADGGSVSGTWGRSIINLAPYAKPKDKVRLRFDLGNDGCGGAFGWYLDDVSVYQCRDLDRDRDRDRDRH